MKKDKVKTAFLEQLTKIPIIQLACEKIGIARATVYRWKSEDKEFKKKMEDALREGETMINDMSEAQVISLIKDKNWHAISFWLRHHHPKYVQRIEITTKEQQEELNPEQEAIVKEALRLSSMQVTEANVIESCENNEIDNEQNSQQPKTPEIKPETPTGLPVYQQPHIHNLQHDACDERLGRRVNIWPIPRSTRILACCQLWINWLRTTRNIN